MKEFWKNVNNVDADLINKIEMKDKRTFTSKTFDLGGGKYHFRECDNIVHYEKNGVLRDIDLTPKDKDGYWLIDVAAFTLKLPKDKPAFVLDGIAYECLETDCRVISYDRWEGADYIITLEIKGTGIQTITELTGAKALRWAVSGEVPGLEIYGRDAAGNSIDATKTFKDGILTETFTGKVRKIIDKKTRRRKLSSDVVYPVKMRG